ncbi:MAG: hypothetical protein LKJ14_04405, partial [Lactobacillus amylovorus]|nr:hypothetical protein [Lactobacillus amylovorus]
ETWCNSLPRKILAYHTPDEIFEKELDHNLSSSINVQFIIAIYAFFIFSKKGLSKPISTGNIFNCQHES